MFNKTFQIDGRVIGENCKPYIIAEMSANHDNDINIAIETIKEAKKAGADAIKIQTYTADTMTLDCKTEEFEAKGAWEGVYLYDLYVDASMPWEWTQKLQEVAKEVGITLFSSPFDFSSVSFLEKLNMPAYKIASPEIIDIPLVRRIAQTGKPIIMSSGNATIGQLNEAIAVMIEEGVKDFALLKCTSEYPASPKNINLKTIQNMKEIFKCTVGLSDHTLGSAISIASVALGSSIIEKHFMLNKDIETADSFFSATPDELKAIVDGTRMVFDAIGEVSYPIIANKPQRSLIAIKDIAKNEILRDGENIKSLRPGGGIEPKFLNEVQNRKITKEIKRGTLLTWELLGALE
ncbi:MAG: pseudaminic acid synthase [Sulfurovum sp.]|nr:pseudaminic acid synthase [Sulfurovaceae bacterium]